MGTTSSRPSSSFDLTQEMIRTFGEIHNQAERLRYFGILPDVLQKKMWVYLTLQEKSNLAKTSKTYKKLLSHDLMTVKMLMLVAQGQETKAQALIAYQPHLLGSRSNVTDYSGRTFEDITAYEYAYWAKDWHMCRMLEAHMDEATKERTLSDCKKIDKKGLIYTQRGVKVIGSKHFDFTALKEAYTNYLQVYERWTAHNATEDELDASWFAIGISQQDVPAYVAQEYCRLDRSFDPRPVFNEPNLPRKLIFFNFTTQRHEQWFPLSTSANSALGVDFALVRVGGWQALLCGGVHGVGRASGASRAGYANIDLAAVTSLDEASTVELTRSRENLKPSAHDLAGPGL